ncbi:hypothetical protein BLNAU_14766 [Blattamonas nauphoetae]|uniref:Uncharacterized protein n=1 Tax=Blattamonas nauphoetae TaxID=2049346 RepID=A0ABQ9XHF3_9EUKA|nr:hypothetical protein BLNAU_14766 [Blattamonas nauphoetae]
MFTHYTKSASMKMIPLQEIVVRYVWALFGTKLRSESLDLPIPHLRDEFFDALDKEFDHLSASPDHSDFLNPSRVAVLSTLVFEQIQTLMQLTLLREPQPTSTPEDLFINFFKGIVKRIFELIDIPTSSSDIDELAARIVDIFRPLTHSSFFTISHSGFRAIYDMLQQCEKGRLLLPVDAIFHHARIAFVEQADVPKVYVLSHRGEWLFSDFLTVLQQLSKDDFGMNDLTFLNKPCFSSAMNEIAEICKRILNKSDSHQSPPPPPQLEESPPSSLVFSEASFRWTSVHDEFTIRSTQEPTLSSHDSDMEENTHSEHTHLSTQISSPPSHENDKIDIDIESSVSPTEQRRNSCLRILTWIQIIRSKRTDTGETDWDQDTLLETLPGWSRDEVTRDHFDHTIFDSVDQYDIVRLLAECNAIFVQTGNLNHLTLTPQYLTKLTLFILSETGFFGDMSVNHLRILLYAATNQREIVSTVFPLLQNAFRRTNENACDSLLWVIVKELQMNGLDSVLLASWADADWIAFFSHRWISLNSLRLFLAIMIDIIWFSVPNRKSHSASNLALTQLFSVSNNILSRSNTLITLFSKSDILGHFEPHCICAISLCFVAYNEPLPSSIHDSLVHFYLTDPHFSTIPILRLLSTSNKMDRFLSSFPTDIVIEKEFSRILFIFDNHCSLDIYLLCNLFGRDNFLMFLRPFLLRALFGEANQQLVEHATEMTRFKCDQAWFKLLMLVMEAEIWFMEGSVSHLKQEARFHQTCREVLPDFVSPIPARRNAALVLLSKVCELADCGMMIDLCRFGVVECVIAGVEASSSLEEYEMGISILGSILRTLTFSESIDTMASFDFSPLLDQF